MSGSWLPALREEGNAKLLEMHTHPHRHHSPAASHNFSNVTSSASLVGSGSPTEHKLWNLVSTKQNEWNVKSSFVSFLCKNIAEQKISATFFYIDSCWLSTILILYYSTTLCSLADSRQGFENLRFCLDVNNHCGRASAEKNLSLMQSAAQLLGLRCHSLLCTN